VYVVQRRVEFVMTKVVLAAVSAIGFACSFAGMAQAQDHSLALTMKLDELVEQLPAGRYHVRKSAIDAAGTPVGQPLRDDHICIKTVGQVAGVVSGYASTFDLSIMAWKAEGAACKSAYHGDDNNAIHETMCATTDKMKAPSRWNVLEADPSCKATYTETGRERFCNDISADVIQVATAPAAGSVGKQASSNHYLAGAITVPGKSLRLHLREFDTAAKATRFVAGHAITATMAGGTCEAGDRPATSIVD
jgi:hypothetical protein